MQKKKKNTKVQSLCFNETLCELHPLMHLKVYLEDKRISLSLLTCFSTVPMVNMLSQNYKKKMKVLFYQSSPFLRGKKIQETTAAEDLTSFVPCFKIHTLKALFQSFINSTVNYT